MSGNHTKCGIWVGRKKKKPPWKNQYIEINVPLWRFKTDGEKVKDSLLLSAFLWQLQCVCFEWAVIRSSCQIIKGAAFPTELGMLVVDYLPFAYPSAKQVSTGGTQPVRENFSQWRCTATPQAWMSLDGSGWQSAHRMLGELCMKSWEINWDPIVLFSLCPHDEILYGSMMLSCVGCVSVGFKAWLERLVTCLTACTEA